VQLYAVIALAALALWFLFDRTVMGMAVSLFVGIGSWVGFMLIITPYSFTRGSLLIVVVEYLILSSMQRDGCPRHYSPQTSRSATSVENSLNEKVMVYDDVATPSLTIIAHALRTKRDLNPAFQFSLVYFYILREFVIPGFFAPH